MNAIELFLTFFPSAMGGRVLYLLLRSFCSLSQDPLSITLTSLSTRGVVREALSFSWEKK